MRSIDDRFLEISQALLLKRLPVVLRIIIGVAAAGIALLVQAAMTPIIGGDKFVLWLVPMILILSLTLGGAVAVLGLCVAIVVDWFVYVGKPMTFALDRAEAVLIAGSLMDALLVIAVCVVVRRLAVRSALAVEDHRILSGELRHRIRNMLAVIGSIAQQSFRSGEPVEAGWQKFDARLSALADVHGLASHGEARPVSMREMVTHALAPFDDLASKRTTVDGPHVTLLADAVLPIRLSLHELATNALKYGALGRPSGKLHVDWAIETDKFVLRWVETGSSIPGPPSRTGFGSRILRQYLRSHLDAVSEMRFEPDGLRLRIEAPARRVAAA